MNDGIGAVCDEFTANSRLYLKLELSPQREALLHFFDRLRREYPRLNKMRRRDEGGVLLEEAADEQGSRRTVRVDPRSLRIAAHVPSSIEDFRQFCEFVFSQAPYHLTFSELDYDYLEVVYGFDLHYRGNHDQLVAETLLGEHSGAGFLFGERAAHIIDAQPYFGIALTPECDLQAYVEVRSRTTTFEVRGDGYMPQPISVLLSVRKYWGVSPPNSLADGLNSLYEIANELATYKVVPHFVNPLAAAIASRS